MVGYLEGIGSERGIAWRCGDWIWLRESGLLKGGTIGVDSTIPGRTRRCARFARRDDGTEYDAWLEQLAIASGIETPTREDLAKLDRFLGLLDPRAGSLRPSSGLLYNPTATTPISPLLQPASRPVTFSTAF